ncbi:MAG: esterase family protein [Acholeplasmatales bacterium]|nr:esterase family protein [Acholeplasmatales bacterium]
MKVEYYKEYSNILRRDMEFKVYGHAGKPCIAFPDQNGRFYSYEDHGIIDSMSWYIEEGKIQVFCVDDIDRESWSATWMNPRDRMLHQEAYYNYIVDEFVKRVYEINGLEDNSGIMTFGVSMGAYHAVNFLLRRPDIFDTVLALSGIYHSGFFIKDYADDLTFLNSPIDSLKCMAYDHPYVELYKKCRIAVCVGQGDWEDDSLNDTRELDFGFKRLGVPALFDYWGYDKPHDWPSWLEQVPHFLYRILD